MDPNLINWILGPGFLGFVSAVLYAILKGNLVPKATVDARIKDKDDKIDDTEAVAKMWKEAATEAQKAVTELSPAVREMTENYKTTLKVIESWGPLRQLPPVGDPK
jgi:uncharacterized Ntn-hydrolase superfamily protein